MLQIQYRNHHQTKPLYQYTCIKENLLSDRLNLV